MMYSGRVASQWPVINPPLTRQMTTPSLLHKPVIASLRVIFNVIWPLFGATDTRYQGGFGFNESIPAGEKHHWEGLGNMAFAAASDWDVGIWPMENFLMCCILRMHFIANNCVSFSPHNPPLIIQTSHSQFCQDSGKDRDYESTR